MARKGEFGYFQLQKTAGVTAGTSLAVGDSFVIPVLGVGPYNPLNKSRPAVSNNTRWLSVEHLGKRSPGFTVMAYAKVSFLTPKMVTSLLLELDANNNTAEFAGRINDGTNSRDYVGARCSRLSIMGAANGGPIIIQMDFACLLGDNEGTSPTWGANTADTGQEINVTQIGWNNTATGVRAWALNLGREQIPDYFADGTLVANRIESKRFFGSLTLQQDPDATTKPTTGCSLRLGATGAGNGIEFQTNLSIDATTEPLDPTQLISETREYTLFNSGAAPIAVATF